MWFIVEIPRRRTGGKDKQAGRFARARRPTRRWRRHHQRRCHRRACEAPLRQLTENAGVDGSIVVRDVRDGKAAYGYNVATGEYVDMFKAGIIDPTKVTRGALENAASIAGLLLVTEAMVADIPKKDPPPPPAPGGMDGMY